MFVETGVPLLLKRMFRMGARKADISVKVAGASRILDQQGLFRIGERNYAILRRILWKNDLLIAAEDVGGTATRTLRLDIGTGRCTVKSNGEINEL